jgi:hypothetical protein
MRTNKPLHKPVASSQPGVVADRCDDQRDHGLVTTKVYIYIYIALGEKGELMGIADERAISN